MSRPAPGHFAISSRPQHYKDDLWVTTQEGLWVQKDGYEVRIPKDFIYDGSSQPKFTWSIIGHPMQGDLIDPSAMHDWECYIRVIPHDFVHRRFYEALKSRNVARWRRGVMYAAVQTLGPKW